MGNGKTEEEIHKGLCDRGIARSVPTYNTTCDPCPVCDEPIPENSHTTLNFGLPDYCSLLCRLEAEADERGENS